MPRPRTPAFDYRTHDGEGSVRVTEPHRLVHAGRRWYLLAWDVDRRDWRTFRVDRIGLNAPAGPRFAPREISEDEVADRLSHGLATATWHYRARVTVHAPAAVIASRLPAAISVEPVDAQTCVIEVGSDNAYMLALNLGLLDADFRCRFFCRAGAGREPACAVSPVLRGDRLTSVSLDRQAHRQDHDEWPHRLSARHEPLGQSDEATVDGQAVPRTAPAGQGGRLRQ